MKNNTIQMTNSKSILYSLFVFLYFTNLSFGQFTIPEKPTFQTSVYDYANMLSPTEKASLENKLIKYSDSTTTQIVAITIESLEGENIGLLAPKWGQQWGIGGAKEKDNGVVILLAKKERKIWIAPGYGVEDKLTAGITGTIVRNVIIPEFKAGSYYNGLDKGADAIFETLSGTYKGTRASDAPNIDIGTILFFIFLFIILIIIFSKNNRGNGGNRGNFGGPDLSDIIILSSLGRGGGGSSWGGGSSGGFGGGFGGGGFSGGGAGGDW
jgi:uncharacterized protein